jgi:hypothetical protein
MIKTRVTLNASGTKELCETYSIEGFKLKQEDTGTIYGRSVIDVIAGYDAQGFPYSKFNYVETEEYDEIEGDSSDIELKAQAYDILMGVSE